jgi:hypothetical protein
MFVIESHETSRIPQHCVCLLHDAQVEVVFEGILDVSTFSLRIAERDVPRILEILQAVPERKIRSMQAHLGLVWHRCGALRRGTLGWEGHVL